MEKTENWAFCFKKAFERPHENIFSTVQTQFFGQLVVLSIMIIINLSEKSFITDVLKTCAI